MLFVVAGPSGAGKSFLIQKVLDVYPDMFVSPPIVTTRPAREGKQEIDRVSVTPEEFTEMFKEKAFAVGGMFQGNKYGFPANIVQSTTKHVIINVWPALLPKFAQFRGVKLIGLIVEDSQKDTLRERMIARGEDRATVNNRMKQVDIDLAQLAEYSGLIRENGAIFNVSTQSAIHEQVLPWILDELSKVGTRP